MAMPHKTRDQEVWQEQPLVQELLAEVHAIEVRMQWAVRWHQLMHQRSPLEIPVQYERLFLRFLHRKEEKNHDHRRGTHHSHRRRVPHQRPCTCMLRINIPGSPTGLHKDKKAYTRGLAWHPSGPLTPVDTFEASRADARRLLRPPPRAASYHSACSYPRWLWPWRHAEQ